MQLLPFCATLQVSAIGGLPTLKKGETMDAIGHMKGWIGGLTDLGLMLLGLAIVAALLVGGQLPFFGGVVTNIIGMVRGSRPRGGFRRRSHCRRRSRRRNHALPRSRRIASWLRKCP
jgi:hypothetical protein